MTHSASSLTAYLEASNAAGRQWPVRSFESLQTAFDFQNDLYANQPLLRWRYRWLCACWLTPRLGARFLAVFNLLYAHCSLKANCGLPAVSPDAALFLHDNYFPAGKPSDPVFHALYQTRQLQATHATANFLNDHHGARSSEATALYDHYHTSLLQDERQGGKMLSGMLGIAERVSPNEIDPASIYSIYHRTVEWTKKKEIGVVMVTTFSSRGKELIRLRVASPDLCAYNLQKMRLRQQLTPIGPELYELLFLMRIPRYSYSTVILHWCEGTEKDEGVPKPVEGNTLPGDAYMLQFDSNGHITSLISNFESIKFDLEAELAVLTPSPTVPHTFVPHGLDPSDPLYINPVTTVLLLHV